MSEYRFTYGNLLILYAVHTGKTADGSVPDYIQERVKVALEIYSSIINSKPDKDKTMVIIVGDNDPAEKIKQMLKQGGVDEKIIAIDTDSKNVSQTFHNIFDMIKTKPNPPYLYFVSSNWHKSVYDDVILSQMSGFRVQFRGSLDHRPVDEVEKEKLIDVPKKGKEYYKQKAKNKAVDMLLNYIFPD